MRTSLRLALARCAYVGLCGVDAWLAGSDAPEDHRRRRATKPLLVPALALATGPAPTSLRAAQVASWVGDVALLSASDRAWATGVGSFAAAHLAYLAGLRPLADPGSGRGRVARRVLTACSAVTGPAVAAGAWRRNRLLAAPVAVYGALLTTMAATAWACGDEHVRRRRALAAGATLFVLSDTTLGLTTFVWPGAPARSESVVMATYTAAQALLALGLADRS